jgi:hypothetical protein
MPQISSATAIHEAIRPRSLNASLSLMLKVYSLPIAALGVLALLWMKTGQPLSFFLKDPAETMNQPFYLGSYSSLILIFWGAAAAVCLFSAVMLRRSGHVDEFQRFLLVSGLTSAFLYLDDMFMLHEDRGMFTTVLHIPQVLTLACYLGWMLYFLLRFRTTILKTKWILLGSALAWFAVSMFVDLTEDRHIVDLGFEFPAHQMIEDGPKLLGVVGWFSYLLLLSGREVSKALATSNSHNTGS